MAVSNKMKSFLLAQLSGNNGPMEALIDRQQSTNQLQQIADRQDAMGKQLDEVVEFLEEFRASWNAFAVVGGAATTTDVAATVTAAYEDADGKPFEPIT